MVDACGRFLCLALTVNTSRDRTLPAHSRRVKYFSGVYLTSNRTRHRRVVYFQSLPTILRISVSSNFFNSFRCKYERHEFEFRVNDSPLTSLKFTSHLWERDEYLLLFIYLFIYQT